MLCMKVPGMHSCKISSETSYCSCTMNLKILFSLILGGVLLVNCTAGGEEAVIFCVKPSHSPTANCSSEECHHCNTLQYYCENVNTTINMLENVTLLFMNGIHLMNSSLQLTAPVIKIKGVSCNVSINCSSSRNCIFELNMINSTKIALENLHMHNVWVLALSQDLYSTYNNTVFFDNCTLSNCFVMLLGMTNAKVKDSTFLNGKLIIRTSSIVFFGLNQLIGAHGYDQEPAITSYSSNITLSGTMLFAHNSAIRGGAIALYYSTLNIAAGAFITFTNNFAYDKGGAIYIEPGISPHDNMLSPDPGVNEATKPPCFYQLLHCSANSTYTLHFANNSARYGGDDIYGATVQLSGSICQTSQGHNECNLTIDGASSDLSSVSSDPLRVCLCDHEGKPLCNGTYEYSHTHINRMVYPGENFAVSAVLVGGDFGTTTGMVYATFLYFDESLITLTPTSQLITNSSQCGELRYSLHTSHASQSGDIVLYLTTSFTSEKDVFYYREGCDDQPSHLCSYNTPIFIDITLLDCPVGFSLTGDPPGCDCYRVLKDKGVKCNLANGTGYLFWNSSSWIKTTDDRTTYTKYCPFDYCTPDSKKINVSSDFDSQCALNRAGRLCGGCKANYSLAIGSSHCIHCHNNNNLALLIFFAAAGFMLVVFISVLNLTVTKGKINGLIFYANVVWIYQSVFISQARRVNGVLMFLKAFIAWINLDFGIETCFVRGLTAFWKTWLQFVFPLYIWVIALIIVMATKRSSKLTTLLGSRAVPVLNTLFLLSYAKLLRVVASAMEFSILQEFSRLSTQPDNRTIVWSADGNLSYFGFPHILLFVAGLATLLFLWLPYTLLLLLLQWLRRLSHVKILQWVTRFHPVYDAYFAPLKHKHQYWFGVLLLVRGVLLVTFASTFGISNSINLLILLILGIVLLFYMTLMQPYKNTALLLLQSSFLVNLTILSGFDIFAYTQPNKQTLMDVAFGISTGTVFVQFCVIVLHSMVELRCIKFCRRKAEIDNETRDSSESAKPMVAVIVNSNSVSLRDSIFEESQKLLIDDP